MSPVNFPLTSYDWATSAKQGTTLKRISEGFSRYGSEANMPTWPRRIPLASLALMPFVTGKLAQYSPRSIRLCCTGCTPHPDTMMQDLSHSYTRAFDANCECGSKVMTVNATVYAAPQALRPDERVVALGKTRREEVRSRSTRRSGAL